MNPAERPGESPGVQPGERARDRSGHDSSAESSVPDPLRILGVLNVTPDSFSDGGRFLEPASAVERGLRMEAEGAHLLDIGGESTRPGAQPVSVSEELDRVLPVIGELAKRSKAAISIDTTKFEVARAALDAGATIVNDVSAGRIDPRILALAAEREATVILMHMRGSPRDMQVDPRYDDVVGEIRAFLGERAGAAESAGVASRRIWIDPGIGFGKRLEHNLEILVRLPELRSLGYPICLGVSRKSFIAGAEASAGAAKSPPEARVGGTAAAVALGVLGGASILRVHDVAVMAQAARVARAFVESRARRA
jgi:dihydropteroate synthase